MVDKSDKKISFLAIGLTIFIILICSMIYFIVLAMHADEIIRTIYRTNAIAFGLSALISIPIMFLGANKRNKYL